MCGCHVSSTQIKNSWVNKHWGSLSLQMLVISFSMHCMDRDSQDHAPRCTHWHASQAVIAGYEHHAHHQHQNCRERSHLDCNSGASLGFSERTMGLRQPLRSAGRVQCTHTPHFSVGRAPLPWPCVTQHTGISAEHALQVLTLFLASWQQWESCQQ